MGKRLDKFRELNSIAGQLKMSGQDRRKLLLATYLRRLRDRISFIPQFEFKVSFPYENGRVAFFLRSNDIDFQHLEGLFVRREYAVPAVNPKRILDLGGNIGAADIFFHSLYPDAEIITIEPLPDNLRILHKNLKANGVSGRVIAAAVSSKPGKARFYLSEADCSSLIPREQMSGKAIDVDCITVPEIMRQAGWDSIDILKVDIEGGEKPLFKDCAEWIGKVGMIIGELHNGYAMDEFNRDTGGHFRCTQVFEYPPPGSMKGILAIRN